MAMLFPESAARVFHTTPDLRVVLFTFAVSLLAVVFFGVGGALRHMRISLPSALKGETSASAVTGSVRFWSLSRSHSASG